MKAFGRKNVSLFAAIAAALLLAGCATPQAESPTPDPDADGSTPGGDSQEFETAATWLDEGRMAAIVTWGSSSCVPQVETITGEGQSVQVVLTDGDGNQACTADLAPRASLVALPSGTDPKNDVDITVMYGDVESIVTLTGNPDLSGTPGESTEYAATAGWFADDSLVLLTWGSSTCLPRIDNLVSEADSATVTFNSDPRPCTMDMAPRPTIISVDAGSHQPGNDFELTLVGDNLDATLNVVNG